MKKILKVIQKCFVTLISFLFRFFFQPSSKIKRTVLKEENILKKKENTTKSNITDNSTNSGASRNLFKEHLNIQKRELFTRKQINEELYKLIEEIFKVKIIDFSEKQKERLKIYSEKVVKKLEEEIHQKKIHHTENLKKSLKEKIDTDIQKKGKDLNKILEIQSISSSEIFVEQELFLESDKKTSTNEIETIKYASSLLEEKKEIEAPIILQESVISENKIPKAKESNKINTYSEIQTENYEQTWDANLPSQRGSESKDLSKTEIRERNKEEIFIGEQEDHKTETNNELKESKMATETNEEVKKELTSEKSENTPEIEINFRQLENQNNKILKDAKTEYGKEELIDKQYKEIEKIITEKIIELESLLNKNLTEEQKRKVTIELEKMKKLQKQVSLHKEQDLEKLRISLEEGLSLNETKLITKKLQEILDKEELEVKNKLLNHYDSKSKKELEKMKKQVIKEQFEKILYRLEFLLFLSFPFIKNKYFRKFIGSLFIFRSFRFIKRILFYSPFIEEPIDLSAVKKGSDALNESLALTEKNIYAFEELKRETFAQYPELLEDEEFLSTVNLLEQKLTENYEKLLKQEKVVNKYFHKSKILTRKRKLYRF